MNFRTRATGGSLPPVFRIVILASGSGSNAEAIAAHCADRADVEVAAIISDRRSAGVHERAARIDVRSEFVGRSRREAPGGLLSVLRKHRPDLIALAGYLRLVPADVLEAYPARVVNVHPALLPKFGGPGMYGAHVHEAVVAAGERHSGITVHLADARYDEGRILFQATCELDPADDAAAVASRVLALEHRHYPAVLTDYLAQLGGVSGA